MLANPIRLNRVTLTPEKCLQLLESKFNNRPLNDLHVKRLAQQIKDGLWIFNGDTIKVSDEGEVLDGQHRLWACIEAKAPIETVVVHGVRREAFATIDTLRRARTPADMVALLGATRYRTILGTALSWLIRWEQGTLPEYRSPHNRVENSDVEAAFKKHPNMAAAVVKCMPLRRLCNPAVLACIYYNAANRNDVIAEMFVASIENPASLNVTHPFYQFRVHLGAYTGARTRDPVRTFALAIKSLNAVAANKPVRVLKWKDQGANAEPFPQLKI